MTNLNSVRENVHIKIRMDKTTKEIKMARNGIGNSGRSHFLCNHCHTRGNAQDSRGWEKVGETHPDLDNPLWLCPDCILNFQAVKDKLSNL